MAPSGPTPAAGAIYLITTTRVHPVDVTFGHAVGVISIWRAGASELLARMKRTGQAPTALGDPA